MITTQSAMVFRRVSLLKLPRFFQPTRRHWLLYEPLCGLRMRVTLGADYVMLMSATEGSVIQ